MRSTTPHSHATDAYALLLPALAIYVAFELLPVAQSVAYSFYEGPGYAPMQFAGLDNYARLLSDDVFWIALGHNLLLIVLSLALQLPLALFLASLVCGRVRARGLWRTLYFLPMILPSVVIAIVWRDLYNPEYGLLNQSLRAIGVAEDSLPLWLASPWMALPAILVAICWRYTGFHFVLYVAGMEAIPRELYEAAELDGAGAWSRFWHVTLPGLRRVLTISILLSIVGSLKYFDLIYVMTRGDGPSPHATELVTTYLYKSAFEGNAWGYASTLATALFAISIAVAIVFLRWRERQGLGS